MADLTTSFDLLTLTSQDYDPLTRSASLTMSPTHKHKRNKSEKMPDLNIGDSSEHDPMLGAANVSLPPRLALPSSLSSSSSSSSSPTRLDVLMETEPKGSGWTPRSRGDSSARERGDKRREEEEKGGGSKPPITYIDA